MKSRNIATNVANMTERMPMRQSESSTIYVYKPKMHFAKKKTMKHSSRKKKAKKSQKEAPKNKQRRRLCVNDCKNLTTKNMPTRVMMSTSNLKIFRTE